jgi:hypothetical protein
MGERSSVVAGQSLTELRFECRRVNGEGLIQLRFPRCGETDEDCAPVSGAVLSFNPADLDESINEAGGSTGGEHEDVGHLTHLHVAPSGLSQMHQKEN